ncbi:MAG TPA: type II secretion system protein GspM [Noviherbaspirillum sp.]
MNAALLNELKQAALTFWSERNKREQYMLIAAMAVIVFGLFYALLIDPALSGRKDLEKKLPVLRVQAAEVQALAKDSVALGSKAVAPVPAATKEGIETSLNSRGLKPQSVALNEDIVRVQLNGVSFAGLIDWLGDMQKTMRLSVFDAKIDAQEKVDTVNATLSLRQQRGEQAQ